MSNPLDITVEQALEVVLAASQRKGWVRPELRDSQNPETQEVLRTLRSIREELGDVVDV
jgi:NTP pyrophosphatase (non-canonical NTP hydrolase)